MWGGEGGERLSSWGCELKARLAYSSGCLSAFAPRKGKMRLYELLGGQVRIHLQSMLQTRGIWGHAPPGNFGFGPLIRHNLWNLELFSHT